MSEKLPDNLIPTWLVKLALTLLYKLSIYLNYTYNVNNYTKER